MQHANMAMYLQYWTCLLARYRMESSHECQHTVKSLWTEIIIDHLQANDMLSKGVHVEVRNVN